MKASDPVLGATNLSTTKIGMKWPREAFTPFQQAELDNGFYLGNWESVERLTIEVLHTNPAPPRDDTVA
jgi:hypothetical protein